MIFLNSASSAAALVFYLPGVCTHTDTQGKQRKAKVWNIFKKSEKNTIFNKHHVSSIPEIKRTFMSILHIKSFFGFMDQEYEFYLNSDCK